MDPSVVSSSVAAGVHQVVGLNGAAKELRPADAIPPHELTHALEFGGREIGCAVFILC